MDTSRRSDAPRHRALVALAAFCALTAARPLAGQVRSLGAPDAVHRQDFALVNTVRELADGSVVVADPLSVVVVRLDPSLHRADTLGRRGEGPEEYLQPDAVWPLPGDSTLLVDLGNARLTVVAPDGTFQRTRPITLGSFEPGRPLTSLIPQGVDGAGAVYVRGSGMGTMDGGALPDSAPVLRVAPGSDTAREVIRVKIQRLVRESSGPASDRQERITAVPLSPVDVWGVAPDGRLAVARAGSGALEWIAPGGARVTGPPLDVRPVPVGDAEKEAWAEERESRGGGIGIQVEVENGRAQVSYARMAGRGGADPGADDRPWPHTMPVFVDEPVRIDPLGRAWARRSQPAGRAPLYDVFDGSGARLFSVRMPEDRRLVGFGGAALYAVRIDPFGLQTLERYALPQ
jgi:hypothetical protein